MWTYVGMRAYVVMMQTYAGMHNFAGIRTYFYADFCGDAWMSGMQFYVGMHA